MTVTTTPGKLNFAVVTFVQIITETVFAEDQKIGFSLDLDPAIAAWTSHSSTVTSVIKTVMVMASVNTEQY